MTDNQLCMKVLFKLYQKRHSGMAAWGDVEMSPVGPDWFRISEQLAERGLIEWRPGEPGPGQQALIKINAAGIDVVEGRNKLTPPVTIHDHSRNTVIGSGATGVQVGDGNSLKMGAALQEVIDLINSSPLPTGAKQEAKNAFQRFLEHPALTAILGGLARSLKW